MAASRLDSDFQLFSPIQPSGDNDAQADSLLFPDAPQDLGQDWTQWMRWDAADPQSNAPQTIVNNTPGPGASKSSSGSPTTVNGVTRKRKSTSDDDGSTVSGLQDGIKVPVPKQKRAHNVVEKRYRANLNEKISELRDSVPSLRPAGTANANGKDDAPKQLNKAVILSKATEYIRHLEIRNKRLEEENTGLKNRMRQVDKAADQSLTSTASVSSPSNCTVSTESGASSSPSIFSHGDDISSDHSPGSIYPPEGLIKAPESFRKMWDSSRDKSHDTSYIQGRGQGRDNSGEGSRRRSRLPNKYMLGALAGLMVVEGVGREKSESKARELLAVPVDLFSKIHSPSVQYWLAVFRSHWHSWHVKASIHFLILAGLIIGSAFLVFVYLFNSQPQRQQRSLKSGPVTDSTSPSSFRRQAWLTSIQQVGVPRHRFFLEWYAVTSRCFEYLLRCLMGWKLYSWVTGITEEDEKGRVKTWDIATDAQLAGGDAEISRSRLVLTVFAAGTLPSIPVRMMQKSLHCRILLWRVGDPGSFSFQIFDNASRVIARYQWEQARNLQRALPSGHPDALPSYLATLLAVESDDVMFDNIVQRAANLTWNRPTRDGTDGSEALMDIVEEDPAIQSSVDALAAWWSSHLLQDALLKYFETRPGTETGESQDSFRKQITLALDVAPQPSAAHTRALVMNAVFLEQNRVENIGKVLSALPREKGEGKQRQTSTFLDSSLPASVRQEIGIAVRCAMIAAVVTGRANGDSSLPSSLTVRRAVTWFNDLAIDPVELTLLGFAAVYHLLHVLAVDTDLATITSSLTSASEDGGPATTDDATQPDKCETPVKSAASVGRVASRLIYWAGNAYNPAFYGLTGEVIEEIETRCTSICRDAGIDLPSYLDGESAEGKETSHPPAAEDFQNGHEQILQTSDDSAQSNQKVSQCAASDGAD